MKMQFICSKDFRSSQAWGSLPIANMNGISIRLHWTNEPYKWHINDGEEVFAVMDGSVCMRYKLAGVEHRKTLDAGDIFFAGEGCEHVAHPIGVARVLVIEREGSV